MKEVKMDLVKIKNLSLELNHKKILDDISLSIQEKSVTAIIGPSGAGKTTLLRTLNLLETPSSGLINIDGIVAKAGQVNKKIIRKIRNKSTMVFQQFNLFKNLTALENVMSPLVYNRKEKFDSAQKIALGLLKEIGLKKIANQYPATLSGGQQQRVSIARAIASKPKIVLFDEPTSALDPELVSGVLKTIAKLARQNITIVIVTHEISFVRQIADRVIFVENGSIVEHGPAKKILSGKSSRRVAGFINSLKQTNISVTNK